MSIDDRLLQMIDVERRASAAADRAEAASLQGGGGGGTFAHMSDDWKAAVDRQLAQLHGDVRNLLYALLASFLILAGMVGGLYVRTDEKAMTIRTEIAQMREAQIKIDAKLDLLLERSKPR